jgi:Cellulase (glycosyl hydrolase family 5)/Peptidase_C39 like family
MVAWGINLNPRAPSGEPADPAALKGVKWARIVFQVAAAHSKLDAAFTYYDKVVAKYNAAGVKILFILNQETFWGNGPWANGDWERYTREFAAECGKIAAHYKGNKNLAWEIWNEGDLKGEASVFLDAEIYAPILKAASAAIKAADSGAIVVLGGLAGGNEGGYITQVRKALGGTLPVDAIGLHPYAHYPPNFAAAPTWGFWVQGGKLGDKLNTVVSAAGGVPVWITEIGVSETVDYPAEQYPMVMKYLEGIQALTSGRFKRAVPVVIWFAWSDIMRHAGIVFQNSQPKPQVYDKFFAVVKAANDAEAVERDPKFSKPFKVVFRNNLRVRKEPRAIPSTIDPNNFYVFGEIVYVDPKTRAVADDYIWWQHELGWSASQRSDGTEFLMLPVDAEGNILQEDHTKPTEAPKPETPPPPKPVEPIKFRVVVNGTKIRTAPRTGTDTLTDKKFATGDIVTVDAASRAEANNLIWWKHDQGWSASQSVDGNQVLMQLIREDKNKNANILEVPWLSQVDTQTAPAAFDCGQACVLMLLKYHEKGAGLTVKNITDFNVGRATDKELVDIAAHFGLTLNIVNITKTVSGVQNGLNKLLAAGRPIILLVNYLDLGFDNFVAKKDPGLHWLVVIGSEGDTFYVNDPLWVAWDRQNRGGSMLPIRIEALARAFRGSALS